MLQPDRDDKPLLELAPQGQSVVCPFWGPLSNSTQKVVKEQLQKAGVRLAHLLDAALAK
jgi:hypothetical protein